MNFCRPPNCTHQKHQYLPNYANTESCKCNISSNRRGKSNFWSYYQIDKSLLIRNEWRWYYHCYIGILTQIYYTSINLNEHYLYASISYVHVYLYSHKIFMIFQRICWFCFLLYQISDSNVDGRYQRRHGRTFRKPGGHHETGRGSWI